MTRVPADRGPRTRSAVLCSVADQGVAAFTNIAVLVVAARLSGVHDFAVFSLVYMVATVLTGLAGSYVGQALVLREGEAARDACRSAVVFTACASCAIGFTAAGVALLLPGDIPRTFAVLGLLLPVVTGQDGLRYCFSTLRLPQRALGADVLRLAVTVPALAVQPDGSGPARLVAVWGLAALPALVLGGSMLAPRLRGAHGRARDLLARDHLGRRFAVEFAVGNGSSQLAIIGLGLLTGPLTVGALRGASTLFGPMNVLCNSATAFGPPLLRRAGSTRATVRTTLALAAVLATTAAAWAVLLAGLPDSAGRQVLGDTWDVASRLLPATGGQYVAIALGTSALLALRVLRPKATLTIQVIFSLGSVAFLVAGFALYGVLGAAWGLCAGSALKAAALWLRTARVGDNKAEEKGEFTDDRTQPAGLHGQGL